MSATILVVEDEPAIRELIAINLELAGHVVQQAKDAEQAIAMLAGALPDLIVLDWMLPGMSGLDLAARLRRNARTHAVPIIMLTARSAEPDMLAGLNMGADDYISKPFSPRELVARIRAVLRRRAPQLTDDAVVLHGITLDPSARSVCISGQALAISPTEFRLLHFFLTHPGRVFSRAQLLDHIWGDHVFLEERTVDVHIRRLRKALAQAGPEHSRLIETVRGAGYRLAAKAVNP